MEHLETCAQTEKKLCPANTSLHGEAPDQHWWSGWPGAFCLKCGDEDKDEICLGMCCNCPCHDELWSSYKQYVEEEQEKLKREES